MQQVKTELCKILFFIILSFFAANILKITAIFKFGYCPCTRSVLGSMHSRNDYTKLESESVMDSNLPFVQLDNQFGQSSQSVLNLA